MSGAGSVPTQREALDFVRERWPHMADVQSRLNKLGEEYGEVLGAFVKMNDGTRRKSLTDLAQETAQLVLCAMMLAEAAGFDLTVEVIDEWDRANQREWPSADWCTAHLAFRGRDDPYWPRCCRSSENERKACLFVPFNQRPPETTIHR